VNVLFEELRASDTSALCRVHAGILGERGLGMVVDSASQGVAESSSP
jgi:hypothetical protein